MNDTKFTCCLCQDTRDADDMLIVQGDSPLNFEEPDWVCNTCLSDIDEDSYEAEEDIKYIEYCKQCWYVMEEVVQADFHPSDEPCPLSTKKLTRHTWRKHA